MKTEIEAKFLKIETDKLRVRLKTLGAKLMYPEREMKRKTFDYADERLRKIGAWVRVRDEGEGKITLSYQRLEDRTLHGTKEITVDVSDFEATCNIRLACGFVQKSYQETKREKWLYKKSEITIDTWPWIPAFVEIESETEAEIKSTALELGFDWSLALHGSVENAYQAYYNVTDDEVDSWETITFTPVPEWLDIKRINYDSKI